MKVLIIGSGGREHALVKSIECSPLVKEVYAYPGSDAISKLATNVITDDIVTFAIDNKIDLTIVGPEKYLEEGIVDEFTKHNLKIFGPTKSAARLETSKNYAKELMVENNIATAKYQKFTSYKQAVEYGATITFPTVIKYDGIAAGKGVVICNDKQTYNNTLDEMLNQCKYGKDSVIVEEFLTGVEFTLMAFVNNDVVCCMDVAQDYKKAYDGDKGLNTGGMGVCSPVPTITKEDVKEATKIMEKMNQAMINDNNSFCGFMYGGFMKCEDGIKVIEFNARFGDPEAEVLLSRMENDLMATIIDIMDNKQVELTWQEGYSVGVVLASNGYPREYENGFEIKNIPNNAYHMGTKYDGGYKTNGGRVLLVVGSGDSIEMARDDVYKKISSIECDNLFYRKDIGKNS